jgi:SAM-dependent methyltransferase
MNRMSNWRSFWDGAHSIYVNDRHKDVHYREIAEQIAAFVPAPGARVLDYGSGDTIHAGLVADAAREVLLCDSAASVRAAMAARFAGNPRIKVISPDEVAALPDNSLDLIVSNSVVQYLNASELDSMLAMFLRLLMPGGTVIIADVIPPDVGKVSDVAALLRYAARHGFLLAALAGLARTAVSPYRKLRSQLGIAQYTEAQFMGKLAAAGFRAERLARNMEHNPARMTFRAHAA